MFEMDEDIRFDVIKPVEPVDQTGMHTEWMLAHGSNIHPGKTIRIPWALARIQVNGFSSS